jgi:hypothetical protein
MEIKERARLEEGKEKEKECAANGGYFLCYFVPLCRCLSAEAQRRRVVQMKPEQIGKERTLDDLNRGVINLECI